MQRIITVGREFGSGGRELGRRLAEELGYDYYDKEIIQAIADKTSLSVEYVKQVVESKPHNLFPITVANSFSYIDSYASQQLQSVYAAQCTILRELAQKSPCVIIGRCADYILADMEPLRMFIYADMDSRVRRCLEREDDGENMSVKEMQRTIRTIDPENKVGELIHKRPVHQHDECKHQGARSLPCEGIERLTDARAHASAERRRRQTRAGQKG